ncbi:S4 domain-containing protein, partial [Streptococcus mutans]
MEIEIKEAGVRLDKALADLTDLSRSQASEQIKAGLVLVNGKTQKTKYAVKVGDIIRYERPQEAILDCMA